MPVIIVTIVSIVMILFCDYTLPYPFTTYVPVAIYLPVERCAHKNIMLHYNKQLYVSERPSQLKEMYYASKKASDQEIYIPMIGSFMKLSFLSRRTSKVRHKKIHVFKML